MCPRSWSEWQRFPKSRALPLPHGWVSMNMYLTAAQIIVSLSQGRREHTHAEDQHGTVCQPLFQVHLKLHVHSHHLRILWKYRFRFYWSEHGRAESWHFCKLPGDNPASGSASSLKISISIKRMHTWSTVTLWRPPIVLELGFETRTSWLSGICQYTLLHSPGFWNILLERSICIPHLMKGLSTSKS